MFHFLLQIGWLTLLGFLCALANCTQADIYEWEYIDPLDPGQGKQQSTTLVPDGAGLDALPDADLSNQNLTMAYLIEADLNGANLQEATLTESDLSQANLENVSLYASYLDGVNFAGANIRGSNLRFTVPRGFTAAQLYSTTSYQEHDLADINLEANNLNGWDFSGQDLTSARFYESSLSNAKFSNAILVEASLVDVPLNNVDFTQADLTDASLRYSTLPNVVFTGAIIRGTRFGAQALTSAQLYSTASYQAQDLRGVEIPVTYMSNWELAGQDLTGGDFYLSNLNNANLSQANLTDANFNSANLTDTDLSGAEIRGAYFGSTTSSGLTSSQFYSTASYQAGDLTGVALSSNNLSGWDFAGMNLTATYFRLADLTGTDFTGATVASAVFSRATSTGFTAAQLYSTASYQNYELPGIGLSENDLTAWDFSQQNLAGASLNGSDLTQVDLSQANLTGAILNSAKLTNANLSRAIVCNADFGGTLSKGFTAVQLYSTASYQAGDLRGLQLWSNDLTGWNFARQDLAGANFNSSILMNVDFTGAIVREVNFNSARTLIAEQLYSTASYQEKNLTGISLLGLDMSDWDFAGQSLTNANFGRTTLTNADFTAADTRGSSGHSFSGVIDTNLICADGTITGLDLTGNQSLLIRDYDGKPDPYNPTGPLPVVVTQQLSLDATSTLELRFEADEWDSQIGFEAGMNVALDGTLLLDFTDNVPLLSQLGRTLQVFDWTGVTPQGSFQVESLYGWDLSQLYTTGEVTLTDIPTLPGDFDADGDVDGLDHLAWQRGDSPDPLSNSDLTAWRANYGTSIASLPSSMAIPEPRSMVLLIISMVLSSVFQRNRP